MQNRPLYDYYIVNIECHVVPQVPYLLEKHSFAFFPSYKTQNIATIHHKTLGEQKFPCLGILFYQPKGKLTLDIFQKLLDDFLTCVCLILPDYSFFSASRNLLSIQPDLFKSQIKTTVNVPMVLNRSLYRIHNLKDTFGSTLIDFNKIETRILRNVHLNFFPFFEQFMSLDRNDKDYQAIKLLILASFMTPFIGRFYDNENMEFSLLFTLLESFLPVIEKSKTYKCKNCGVQVKRNFETPVSDRFNDYVNKLPISNELRERATGTFDCMRPIRNKFYHEAESQKWNEVNGNLKKLTGRSFNSYKKDIELNNGRELGPLFMQDLIRTILLTKLLNKSCFNESAGFKDNRLWDHFKPTGSSESIDVSFCDFDIPRHGFIADFVDLEKRINSCKIDKVCIDREIRQFYFENENSTNPIMIICDTPAKSNKFGVGDNRELNWSKINCDLPFSRIITTLNLEDAYITNLVKCGSNYGLSSTDTSIKNCWQFLLREIEFINPKLILCVGKTVFAIISRRNLSIPVEYVPHYNYLRSEEAISDIWKEAIIKHPLT